jgi:hypothetical protein
MYDLPRVHRLRRIGESSLNAASAETVVGQSLTQAASNRSRKLNLTVPTVFDNLPGKIPGSPKFFPGTSPGDSTSYGCKLV